jgi:predicted nucleic acid-binding protein
VNDCADLEENLVFDLAAEVGALLLVSEDADLTTRSPWRGVPILRAAEFTARVDAMRRHQRRRSTR